MTLYNDSGLVSFIICSGLLITRMNLPAKTFDLGDIYPLLTNVKALRWSNPLISSSIAFLLASGVNLGSDFSKILEGFCVSGCLGICSR